MPHPYLSIVIPAYNEARRLGPSLTQIRDYVRKTGLSAEVVVVDDGSTDGTAEVVRQLDAKPLEVRLLVNEVNRGKGHSVRRGILEAEGDVLLMTDADQSTPLREIEKLLPYLNDGYAVVIGSRDHPDADLNPPQGHGRRTMGWLLRGLRRRLMLRDLSDTQCGFKLFTRRAAHDIFTRLTVEGFAFDCEVLLLARKLGYRIKETGVVWCNDPDSRVRPVRDSFRMLSSLVRLRWLYR